MTPIGLALTLISGIAWTVVYVDAIRIGFKERTYAIPIAALALNFAWEATYAALAVANGLSPQGVINIVWAAADVVIVVTFFRFGRAELPAFVTRGLFVGWGILIFAVGFAVQWLFIARFGQGVGGGYAAFLQNALMSGLFIAMFVARRGRRGQTLTIAIAKWIGTLAPTIAYGLLAGDIFVLGLGLICSALDLTYIGLLVWARVVPHRFADATAPAPPPGQAVRA